MAGKPKPTKLKILEGNRGRRKLPDKEPQPKIGAPEMPDYLDKEAVKIWKQLAPYLVTNGLLTVVDGIQFSLLCQTGSYLRKIIKYLNEKNKSLTQAIERPAPDGGVKYELKSSPYEVMFRLQTAQFHKLAAEFGLSPRGRVGLQIGGGGDDDGEDLIK